MKKTCLVILVVVANCAIVGRATTLIPADLRELTQDAVAIVRGRVAAVESRWTDDRRAIETLVTIDSDAYLKGNLGPTVQFRVPGGLLGRFRSIVVGAPRFGVGDRVIVFLGGNGPAIPHLVGFSQGVYRVVRDRATADLWRVTPPPIEPPASDTAVKIVRGDPARVPLALGDFEARVRALAGSAK